MTTGFSNMSMTQQEPFQWLWTKIKKNLITVAWGKNRKRRLGDSEHKTTLLTSSCWKKRGLVGEVRSREDLRKKKNIYGANNSLFEFCTCLQTSGSQILLSLILCMCVSFLLLYFYCGKNTYEIYPQQLCRCTIQCC